jgi:hypothetical protein
MRAGCRSSTALAVIAPARSALAVDPIQTLRSD